jgi:tRNA dimethylallyltransferase
MKIIIIAGPTASGKSALALHLAKNYLSCIINADSAQIYADIPILSAQPSFADRAAVCHKLYGTYAATCLSSAGKWVDLANVAIEESFHAAKIPIIVGGTGMYIHSLINGIAPIPPIEPELRASAIALHQRIGADEFYQQLVSIDPIIAQKLRPGDTQRVIRAYEIFTQTGISQTIWQEQQVAPRFTSQQILKIVLAPDRAQLYENCNMRFREMMERGAIQEVERLMTYESVTIRALGMREIMSYLAGEVTYEQAIIKAQQLTRNYAKRQITWFKHQLPSAKILSYVSLAEILPQADLLVKQFLQEH